MKQGVRTRAIALTRQLGPGLITGAADDDPSGIATYSQAGAQAGYGLLWTMVLTYPLMCAIQLVSAYIGRVTGVGLAANMAKIFPRFVVTILVVLLFVANTINIGADLAVMGAVAGSVIPINAHVLTIGFALVSLLLQLFIPYRRYATFLKWLTLVLLAYFAVLLFVHIDGRAVLTGLVVPHIGSKAMITTIVAVFGTTISPYLFFWQTAQEVEEVNNNPLAEPLVDQPWQARREFRRIWFDTLSGMGFSTVVAIAIIIAAAATLHARGITDVQSAQQAAQALEPVAGRFAFLLFSFGVIGTGMLAIPVLAGSAAYGIGDSRGWESGLEYKVRDAPAFYSVIAAATLLGIVMDWSRLDPIKALFWSAVINGVVAVPMMLAMMIVVSRHSRMGKFTAPRIMTVLGWAATAIMAIAALAMFIF
ncbi:NRAMP family divalent metal transporter [Novosphingobium sp.]|uniref:NRAMP family divalent metal transporter n=1 Tax=Novosphingobium sp. TaxID=1874826 RepID=UPI003B5195B5